MQRTAWSKPVSAGEAYARSAGRRHSNAVRQLRATVRRGQVAELVLAAGGLVPGVQARIACDFGVHRSTVCRDVRAIFRGLPAPVCPCCGALRARALELLDELLEAIRRA